MTMMSALQQRSMGCSDNQVAPRRIVGASPLAAAWLVQLCNTLAGTDLQLSNRHAVREDAEHQ